MSPSSSLPHDRSDFFKTAEYYAALEEFFRFELRNDGRDVSTECFIDKNATATAVITAKEEGILAGREELTFFLDTFFSKETVAFSWEREDGEAVMQGQKIFTAEGTAAALMKWERIFLNVLSRMSGIATQAQKIRKISGTGAQVAATRKTQWSYMDKKAVHIGGGLTHRMGLFDAIMLKENHQIIGGYDLPIASFLQKGLDIAFFEIEVETPQEFHHIFSLFWEADDSLPKVIMLDNFSPEMIQSTLEDLPTIRQRHQKNIFLEASGGISEETLAQYSSTGVDVVSLGALTNFVRPIDYSLRIKKG